MTSQTTTAATSSLCCCCSVPPPPLYWTTFCDTIVNDTRIKFPAQNIAFTGGGMAAFFQTGFIGYLLALRDHRRNIRRIYGTSAGSLASVMFALMLNDPTVTIDHFLQCVAARLQEECVKEQGYLVNAWCTILRELLPENIHEYCTDRVFINILVLEKFRFKAKVISRYASKEHVIDVVRTSMSIPILTIPGLWARYTCPFEKKSFMAFDGIALPRVQTAAPTLVVDIYKHTYPTWKRLHIFEKSYDFMVMDGIKEAGAFFASDDDHDDDDDDNPSNAPSSSSSSSSPGFPASIDKGHGVMTDRQSALIYYMGEPDAIQKKLASSSSSSSFRFARGLTITSSIVLLLYFMRTRR